MQAIFGADLISQIAPKDYRHNNYSLFNLARLFKSYEKAVGQVATPARTGVLYLTAGAFFPADFGAQGLRETIITQSFLKRIVMLASAEMKTRLKWPSAAQKLPRSRKFKVSQMSASACLRRSAGNPTDNGPQSLFPSDP